MSSNWSAAILGLAVLGFPVVATPQNVVPIRLEGQPLMYMKDGRPRGCGIRIFGFHETAPPGTLQMVDVSVNVHVDSPAAVKLTAANSTISELATGGKPRPVRVASGWVRAENAAATQPLQGKTAAGEDGLSLLYWTDADSVLSIFTAQAEQRSIMIGVRRDQDTAERIYVGPLTMSGAESKQVTQCLRELSASLPR